MTKKTRRAFQVNLKDSKNEKHYFTAEGDDAVTTRLKFERLLDPEYKITGVVEVLHPEGNHGDDDDDEEQA